MLCSVKEQALDGYNINQLFFSFQKKAIQFFFEIREESCFLYREGCVCSKEERKWRAKIELINRVDYR